MSRKDSVKVIVEGGAATAGPPLGPAIGPLGVNTGKVVEAINKATEGFMGLKVPVEVIVDSASKEFEVKLGSPPTSSLLVKALGIEKGGGSEGTVGDLSVDQVLDVAKSKRSSLLARDLNAAYKEVVGTCQSLKITIAGLTPKEMTEAVNSGVLDDYIAGKTDKLPKLVHREEKKVKILGVDEEKPKAAEEAEETEGEPDKKDEKDEKKPDKKDDKKPDKKGGKR